MSQTAPTSPDNFLNVPIPPSKQRKCKKPIPLLLGLLVVGVVLVMSCGKIAPREGEVDVLKLSGRIEGYETEIGIKRSGRIESIALREGAYVKKGQELIKLDDSNDQLLQ